MRTFVYTDEKSNKFWNIELEGDRYEVTFGKVGTAGRTQTKSFATAEKARKAYEKVVAEKLAKGYVETTVNPTRVLSPEQAALEKALVANPDDLAAHSAYADYLMEQGDPRGEFIQVQLTLEDESRSTAERNRAREREAELLALHAKTWLGDAGRFLVGDWSGPDKPFHYQFVRGWLDRARMLPMPEEVVAAVANSPESRLLRLLEVVYDMRYHPFDFDLKGLNAVLGREEDFDDDFETLEFFSPVLDSPYLSNLRVLRVGFSDSGERIGHSTMIGEFRASSVEQVIQLLIRCPRLEELYLNFHVVAEKLFASPLLGQLRVFQYYYGSGHTYPPVPGQGYPLHILAENKSLAKLTTLRLHAGRDAAIGADQLDFLLRSPNLPSLTHLQVRLSEFGDEGARRIVTSGVLRKLKLLDIGYGSLTDDGAELLASCPDLKQLQLLDVSRNALTSKGIAALRKTGVNLVAEAQHDPDERDYLYEVDFE